MIDAFQDLVSPLVHLRLNTFNPSFADKCQNVIKLPENTHNPPLLYPPLLYPPCFNSPFFDRTGDIPAEGVFTEYTFKSLAKWNSSLQHLEIIGYPNYECCINTIKGPAFAWTPSLISLTIQNHGKEYLSNSTFVGLMQLQKLDLSKNELIIIPLEAMKVFEQSKTLKFFDLSENSLTGLNDIFIDEILAEIESIEHFNMAKNRLESLNMNDLGTLTELDLRTTNYQGLYNQWFHSNTQNIKFTK